MSTARIVSLSTVAGPAGRTALAALATLVLAPAVPAQWTANAKKNTFAASPCLPPLQPYAQFLALDPVMVPCDDGCFYAWIDPAGRVNIQVIDACGYPKLSPPFVVPGTSSLGGPLPHFTQLAGCTYANGDGARNQLFLAYTLWNGARDQMLGQCFEYTTPNGVPTLTPGSTVPLVTTTAFHGILTPVANTSFDTSGANQVIGAVWGCRDWDFILGSQIMTIGSVTGPFTAPTPCSAVIDTFTLPAGATPTRLSVLSDDAGGVYGAWRGSTGTAYYYGGTRLDATCAAIVPWPALPVQTTRTTDDWVLARDLAGGVFVAWREDPGSATEALFTCHVTGANVWSNIRNAATVPAGQLIAPLAMATQPATNKQHAALLYRANTSILVRELNWSANTLASAWSTSVGVISGTADARGCATRTSKGFAVGWIGDFAVGSTAKLYGQELDSSGSKLWNNGNPLEVSVNLSGEDKFVPMVVSKYSLPEVIYGWVDTRTAANSPGATIPGGYVQSVADDFVSIPHAYGFRPQNGKLGSMAHCFSPLQHFPIHDQVYALGTLEGSGLGAELYVLDPTDDTYELVGDIHPGALGSSPGNTFRLGNRRLFEATSAVGGREPWVTDGTTAGTLQLADCEPGAGNSAPTILGTIREGASPLALFVATSSTNGRELWRTDGTPAGTAMVLDLNPGASSGIGPATGAVLGGNAYFWGDDGVHGRELWRSDGTATGTSLVAELSPGSASTGVGGMAVLGDKLVFSCLVTGLGSEPYALDSATGTVTALGDLAPGSIGSAPSSMAAAAGLVWFGADDRSGIGRELWCTDGTPAGTRLVLDIHATGSSNPREFADAGSFVLFLADDGVHGAELWRSDGTAAGTMLLADLNPGSAGSFASQLTPIGGGRFLFSASSAGLGFEPWITDGTAAGTSLLADLNPGPGNSGPTSIDVVAGAVYFAADVAGERMTLRLTLDAPAVYGQGCAGSGGRVPRIGAPGGSPRIGQAFAVSLQDAAPNSLAFLALSVTGTPVTIGSCTLYVGLPVLDAFAAFTDAAGNATVTLNVPNDPALVGFDLYWQWAVADPAGPLLGAFSVSDAMRATID